MNDQQQPCTREDIGISISIYAILPTDGNGDPAPAALKSIGEDKDWEIDDDCPYYCHNCQGSFFVRECDAVFATWQEALDHLPKQPTNNEPTESEVI